MKRKLFMTIIAVLIVCLTCGMLLVACNPDEGNNGGGGNPPVPETRPENSVTMMTTVWNQIASSINVGDGKKFIADFDIALNIDDETEANNDVVYSLVGKASIDVNEGKESDIFIELKATKNGESKVLFGFAYDVEKVQEADVPFIYVSAGGSEYKKINGFYLTQLVADIQDAIKNAGNDGEEGIIDKIEGIIDAVKGFMDPELIFSALSDMGVLPKNGTISDYGKTYTVDMTVAPIFNALSGLMTDDILSLIGLSVEQLDSIAKEVSGFLGFEGIETFAQLCSKIADALKFLNTQLVFKFDDNGVFTSAAVNLDYNKNNDGVPSDFAKYTVSVNKAVLNVGELDVFAGSSITDDVRAQESVNLLNFSVSGSAIGYKTDGSVNRTYDIFVQSDINPFYLLQLIGDTSKENILATLKQLGYFHLEVNETTVGSEGNIITIHSNFADGFAVVQFDVYNVEVLSINAPLALGGVYDFDALIDVIGMLTAKDEAAASADEGGIDFMAILKEIVNFIHFDNLAENGLVLDINSIFTTVLKAVNSLAVVAANSLTGGNNTIAIKLDTPVYGNVKAEDYISYGELKPYQMQGGYTLNKDRYVKQVVGMADGVEMHVDPKTGSYIGTDGLNKAYKFKGIDVNGEEVEFYGYIMTYIPVGEPVDGKQKVTMYVAQASEMIQGLDGLAGFGLALPSTAPLMGVMKFDAEFETFDSTAQKTFVVDKFYQSEKVGGPSGMIKIQIGDLVYEERFDLAKATVLDSEGKDVTGTVIKSILGNVKFGTVSGTYTMKYNSDIGMVEQEITVGKLEMTYSGEALSLGGKFDFDQLKLEYVSKDSKGQEIREAVEFDKKQLTYSGYAFDKVFKGEEGNYTIVEDNLLLTSIQIKGTCVSGLGNTISYSAKAIPCETGYEITTKNIEFGESLNNQFTVKVKSTGVTYSIVYENGKWIGKSEDGQTKDLEFTMAWLEEGGKAVTVDENGIINNTPDGTTGKNQYVFFTIKIDGKHFSARFQAKNIVYPEA